MRLLQQVGGDFLRDTSITSAVTVPVLAAARGLERVSPTAAVPDAIQMDARELVSRAYALLAQESEAWRTRQRADALPRSSP